MAVDGKQTVSRAGKGTQRPDMRTAGAPTFKSRIKSCELNFKEHRNKMAKKLASESSEVFRSLCNRLPESQTPDAYHEAKTQMDQFINSAVERSFLKSWLAWWHDRRGFIFRTFAPRQGPQMNQAEVVHAG